MGWYSFVYNPDSSGWKRRPSYMGPNSTSPQYSAWNWIKANKGEILAAKSKVTINDSRAQVIVIAILTNIHISWIMRDCDVERHTFLVTSWLHFPQGSPTRHGAHQTEDPFMGPRCFACSYCLRGWRSTLLRIEMWSLYWYATRIYWMFSARCTSLVSPRVSQPRYYLDT